VSLARRLGRWLAWELGRTIEVTPVIRLITLERFFKSAILIAGGVAVLVAGERGSLQELLLRSQAEYNLNENRGLVASLLRAALERVVEVRMSRVQLLALGALLYGLLEGFEGVGLVLRRRWAEYLVLLATVVFVPVEIRELLLRPSAFKALALLVNLLIVAYLVYRKRLFLERPGAPEPA
jgi:uncharacterized membrane protein (DUF2068 family)